MNPHTNDRRSRSRDRTQFSRTIRQLEQATRATGWLLALSVILILVAGAFALAGCDWFGGGEEQPPFGGTTNLDSLTLSSNLSVGGTSTLTGATTQTGALTLGGALNMEGNILDLDADNDTSLTASTDDQIDIEISGADDFVLTANRFDLAAGSAFGHASATYEGVVFAGIITNTYSITTSVTSLVIPANADVVDWMLVIPTAYNDSGTDVMNCGSAADGDKYVDDLNVGAAGRNVAGDATDTQQDEWTTSFGDVGGSNLTVSCIYTGQNADASAGAATFVIWYRID